LRRAHVSSTLDQDVENEAILIDGALQPVLLARDRDGDLIHMQFVAANRRALADLIGELAKIHPHWRTVSCVTQIPRAASISWTMRRLKGNRK
jgi:hypothetical protein